LYPSVAKYYLILLFNILFFQAYCQQRTFTQNEEFAKYLIDNKEYTDALYTLEKSTNKSLNLNQVDTLNFYKGLIFYKQKNFDTSFYYLSKIVYKSNWYYESAYYNVLNKTFVGDYNFALKLLDQINYDTLLPHYPLKNFEQASLALIKRDYKSFDQLSPKFDSVYFPISIEQKDLIKRRKELSEKKKKYPVIAGALSTIIPGTGKIYAGMTGQGIAAFVMVGMLGGITAETYIRSGPKNPQFIIMGSLFTVFYIGNIYGSVFSVKISNEKYNDEVNKILLFNMRIPVTRIFNY
jgi:TM2 domain-containing membrane protein YozV